MNFAAVWAVPISPLIDFNLMGSPTQSDMQVSLLSKFKKLFIS